MQPAIFVSKDSGLNLSKNFQSSSNGSPVEGAVTPTAATEGVKQAIFVVFSKNSLCHGFAVPSLSDGDFL